MADDDDAGPSEEAYLRTERTEVFEETESRESFLAAVDARRIRVEKLLSRCVQNTFRWNLSSSSVSILYGDVAQSGI